MDQIKSYLTPAERQELFRQFKSAMKVKSTSVRRTSRIYEGQLKKLKQRQQERGNVFSRVPSTDDVPQF